MKSWRTTALGIIAAATLAISGMEDGIGVTEAISAVAIAVLGFLARDNSVSSEDAGIKK